MSVPSLAQRHFCIAVTEKSDLYYQVHPPHQKQTITSQICSLDGIYLLHIPHMPIYFVHPSSCSLMMAENSSQYVSNSGSFSVCFLISTQGLESTAWRACETPTLVAEIEEADGEGRSRGLCCSPKGNVKVSNYLKKQQGQD